VLLGNRRFDMELGTDRFLASQPLLLKEDPSELRFTLESDNPEMHVVKLRVSSQPSGKYTVRDDSRLMTAVSLKDRQESSVELPMDTGPRPKRFTISSEAHPEPLD
jgi:hypothetical protein